MSENFLSLVTKIGKKKMTNAIALGKKVELTSFAVGDGNGGYYEISEEQTQLKRQVWEGPLSKVIVSETNQNEILAETYIPVDVGGFYIREAGLFDKDGDLIVIAKHPETYKPTGEFGAYKDLTIRIIIALTNAANVVLKVDPSIVVATQKDLQDLIDNLPSMLDLSKYEKLENKGKADGYAPLGIDGKVPAKHLPVPAKGLELGETEDTAYRGDRGKKAYEHSLKPHAPEDAYSKEDMDNIIAGIKTSALKLGETETTALDGYRGMIAFNHAKSKHADPNAITEDKAKELLGEFTQIIRVKADEGDSYIDLVKIKNTVFATLNSIPVGSILNCTIPVGFRPKSDYKTDIPYNKGQDGKVSMGVSTTGKVAGGLDITKELRALGGSVLSWEV